MAKKGASDVENLRSHLPDDVAVIPVPISARVQVEVDVNDMVIPYTVAIDGRVVIKSLVDRREEISPLTAGIHRLGWGFAHNVKGWSHKVTLIIDDKSQELEKRSEAEKHPDSSMGVAFLVVS